MATVPYTFTDGTGNVIYASQINENFDSLMDAINAGALSNSDATLTSLFLNGIGGGVAARAISGDTTLGTSNATIPTQLAVKTYVDSKISGENIWDKTSGTMTQLVTNTENVLIQTDSSDIDILSGGWIDATATGGINIYSSAGNITSNSYSGRNSLRSDSGNITVYSGNNVDATASSGIFTLHGGHGILMTAQSGYGVNATADFFDATATDHIDLYSFGGNITSNAYSGRNSLRANSGNITIYSGNDVDSSAASGVYSIHGGHGLRISTQSGYGIDASAGHVILQAGQMDMTSSFVMEGNVKLTTRPNASPAYNLTFGQFVNGPSIDTTQMPGEYANYARLRQYAASDYYATLKGGFEMDLLLTRSIYPLTDATYIDALKMYPTGDSTADSTVLYFLRNIPRIDDPHVAGALWADSNRVVRISNG